MVDDEPPAIAVSARLRAALSYVPDDALLIAQKPLALPDYCTRERYEAMRAEQAGKCAICGTPESPDRRLSIDHDHATGRVRGLLCSKCNTGIGMLGDSGERLRAASGYLDGI